MIGTRKQIQLVQILVAQDAEGRNKEQEGDKFGVWADILAASGFRDYMSGQTQMGNTKKFLTRFRFDKFPDCNWKIRYQGKDWTITNIELNKEKKFYWIITATAKSDV